MDTCVRYGDLVAAYHKDEEKNNKYLAIMASGAPCSWYIDWYNHAQVFFDNGYDVLAPDYYWFGRSYWAFTPENCVKTYTDTFESVKSWDFTDVFSREEFKMNYERIIFVWSSFWGWILPILPKYNDEIDNIVLLAPALSYKDSWKIWYKEETVEEFTWVIKRGFENLYRWYDLPEWDDHFADEAWLTPILETDVLEGKNVFIVHWTSDEIIHYSRSQKYFDDLSDNREWNFSYLEIEDAGHWTSELLYISAPELFKFLDETN